MNNIIIFDTTLRDGEQSPGCSMSIAEKVEVARRLEILGVNVIEAGFPMSSRGDFESVKEIAKTVRNTEIAALSRCNPQDIDLAFDAVKNAENARLHLFLATSPIHLKHKLKLSEDEVIEKIAQSVAYAKKLISNVEFSCEDASRTPLPFLAKAVETAVKAGATTINLPDTVGYFMPDETAEMISYVKNNVRGIENTVISIHNHNDLGLAVANSLAAVKAGATQVECTLCGIGERAGNAALEEIVMGINVRERYFNATTSVNTKELYKSCKLLCNIIGRQIAPNKAIVGKNVFAHEAGIHQHGVLCDRSTYEIMHPENVGINDNKIVLGKHSGKHAFADHLGMMGYSFDDEKLSALFEKFKILADKKKTVTQKDIEALVTSRDVKFYNGYSLVGYDITASSSGNSIARLSLSFGGKIFDSVEEGSGPVDASFKAVNNACSQCFVLEDFSLNAVTEGQDAQGEAVVRLSLGSESVVGRGLSTDIIEAAIIGYLNAVNKLLDQIDRA